MLKVSIFERMKGKDVSSKIQEKVKRTKMKMSSEAVTKRTSSTKHKHSDTPKKEIVQFVPETETKCFFSSGRKKITCSRDGIFDSRGNPKNKCPDFPCTRYDEVMFTCKNRKNGESLNIEGQTAEEWADEFFRFELCEVCGGDKADHDIIPFNGHWFARCKKKGEE